MNPELLSVLNGSVPVILSLIGWSLRKWAKERDDKDAARDQVLKEVAALVNTQTIKIAILEEKVSRLERERDDA